MPDVYDVMGALGIGLIGYGSWLIYPPAGLIAPGLLLVALAIAGGLKGQSHQAD